MSRVWSMNSGRHGATHKFSSKYKFHITNLTTPQPTIPADRAISECYNPVNHPKVRWQRIFDSGGWEFFCKVHLTLESSHIWLGHVPSFTLTFDSIFGAAARGRWSSKMQLKDVYVPPYILECLMKQNYKPKSAEFAMPAGIMFAEFDLSVITNG